MNAKELNEKVIRIHLRKAIDAYRRGSKERGLNMDKLVEILMDEFVDRLERNKREVKENE